MKILFLSLFFGVINSSAFSLNSPTNSDLRGWAGGDVKIYLNAANCPAGVDVAGLISDAAAVWNNVPTSSIKVSYGGPTSGTASSSPPTIYCETNFNNISGNPDPNFVAGAASVRAPNGEINSGLMFLNATGGQASIGNFEKKIITVIIAHEIGHLLGLGHSTSTNALMYYDASYKQDLRLSQDDIDGMSYLYPTDEIKDGKFAGCGLVKNLPPPGPFAWGIGLVLMLLPVGLTLNLRSRPQVALPGLR